MIYCEWLRILAEGSKGGGESEYREEYGVYVGEGREARWAGGGERAEIGFEGLQILDARLYYDRSLLTPYLRVSEQEVEKFGGKS